MKQDKTKAVKKNSKSKSKSTGIKPVYKFAALIIAIIFLVYMLFANVFEQPAKEEYLFKKESELIIADSAGHSRIELDIEIADTDFDRQLGLMFRKTMEENQGMLFIFPAEEIQSFWMRNTFMPLDILFIDSAKKIVTIHKNALPLSDSPHASKSPAKYVLEVNSGFTDKYNIKEGDKIQF